MDNDTNERKRRVALYARVSTAEQDPENQLPKLREWAERNGYAVHMERQEIASGRLTRRPLQDEIMAAARGHHVHAVAVLRLDRWGRNMRHIVNSVEELHNLHVEFIAVDQGIQVRRGDPMSEFLLHVMGAFAQLEAKLISERTKDGLRVRRAAGVRLGRRPKACTDCGGERPGGLYAKRGAAKVAVCEECKVTGGERKGVERALEGKGRV